MKRKYTIKLIALLSLAMFVVTSCKEDGPFKVIKSSNSIMINGSVDNLTLPGGIATVAGSPTGAVAPFEVSIASGNATSVTITNRYVVVPTVAVPAPAQDELVLGTFPVVGGKASIPAFLVANLRSPLPDAVTGIPDPVINTTTATSASGPGTNNFLIDATLSTGGIERRIVAVTLANTVVIADNDIYKANLPSSTTAGAPAFSVTVNSTAVMVRVTTRYVVPGLSTPKNYVVGGVNYQTITVDPVTRNVSIPAWTVAQLRDPLDPQITGLSDVGQQFLLVDAMAAPSSKAGTITTSSTSTTVTGVGTAFTSALAVGNTLYDVTGTIVIGTVASIASATSLTLTSNAAITTAGTPYTGNSVLSSKTFNLIW